MDFIRGMASISPLLPKKTSELQLGLFPLTFPSYFCRRDRSGPTEGAATRRATMGITRVKLSLLSSSRADIL